MSKECKCSMTTRLVGDGCSICNPQYYIDILEDEIADLQAELEELKNQMEYKVLKGELESLEKQLSHSKARSGKKTTEIMNLKSELEKLNAGVMARFDGEKSYPLGGATPCFEVPRKVSKIICLEETYEVLIIKKDMK